MKHQLKHYQFWRKNKVNKITLTELDKFFREFLNIENFLADPSKNGIQISNYQPNIKEIKKIGFAVDACEASAIKAAELGCDILFVHHGIFWGHEQTLTGNHYKRIYQFLKNDMALYACHIPLDANKITGNNFGLAKMLDLKNIEEFGLWRGMSIGAKGCFSQNYSIEEVAEKLKKLGMKNPHILKLGKDTIKTVGIISGGAGDDVTEAIAENLDLYITGEIGHENFHIAKEGNINVIGLGHYDSETIGVNLVKEKVEKELSLETVFIDLPTGL